MFPYFVHRNLIVQVLAILMFSHFHISTYRTKQVVTSTSKNLQGATFYMRTMKSIVKVNKFMWSPLSLAAGSSMSYLQQDFDLKSGCR